MLFSTPIFLFLFLPLVIIGYYVLRDSLRIYFLMLASLFFYAWGEPRYIIVMLISITVNYLMGLALHISANQKKAIRLTLLIIAIAGNVGILFYFKYLDFALENINLIFGTGFVSRNIIMPIGISFFTFQGMSYIIDLYKGKVEVQKNPAIVAFYISFFPQLIAGPIVRYIDIKEQIYNRTETLEKFVSGAKRFIIGLAKKVIIANSVGYVADTIFATSATDNTAMSAWIAIICYTFQIFFDFSGYSDMAIGLAKMFGFEFKENFNYPYISKSVTEFWRRWHISLSSWFRDYLYIPLGGNRTGNVYVNLIIVFLVTGLWHGASWNFIIWGLWHGLFLIIERVTKLNKLEIKWLVPFRHIFTMLIVIIGWVFFRVEGFGEALSWLGVMFGVIRPEDPGFTIWYYIGTMEIIVLAVAIIASLPFVKTKMYDVLSQKWGYKYIAGAATIGLFFVSIMFVVSSSYNPFIYFRF